MVVEGIDLTRNPYTDEVSYYPTSDILVTVMMLCRKNIYKYQKLFRLISLYLK